MRPPPAPRRGGSEDASVPVVSTMKGKKRLQDTRTRPRGRTHTSGHRTCDKFNTSSFFSALSSAGSDTGPEVKQKRAHGASASTTLQCVSAHLPQKRNRGSLTEAVPCEVQRAQGCKGGDERRERGELVLTEGQASQLGQLGRPRGAQGAGGLLLRRAGRIPTGPVGGPWV